MKTAAGPDTFESAESQDSPCGHGMHHQLRDGRGSQLDQLRRSWETGKPMGNQWVFICFHSPLIIRPYYLLGGVALGGGVPYVPMI